MEWKPEIQWKPITQIIPYARNTKKHPAEQIQKIAASLHANGFTQPIAVDKEGVIVAGHGRFEAAKQLGMKDVPVVVMDHLDEHQIAAYRIADNRVAQSEWDTEMLTFELGSLDLRGFDLDLTGFDKLEIEKLLGANVSEAGLPDLPEGERGALRQMAFQLTEDQQSIVGDAIALSKSMGEFADTGSSNSNGNALERMAKLFMETHGTGQADSSSSDQ